MVSLREITDANRPLIEALSVSRTQQTYVAGVTESLAEAIEYPDACPWFRAIYAGDEPAGFVMISDGITVQNPDYLGPYYLWRLLIDEHYQGRGIGAATIRLIVEHLRTRPDADVLITSTVPGPESPVDFYLRQGFALTGEVHNDEAVLELALRPRPS